jgi:hypothetical protein
MRGRDVELGCRCGAVHGVVKNASPHTVSRAVCYCDDCQAFLHQLGRAELMNERGGSDVVQVAPATLSFDRGSEYIVGLRLSPKGLYRWYASCCKTPLGNTLEPAFPFVGINIHSFVGTPAQLDQTFGKATTSVRGEFAVGGPPAGSTKFPLRLILRALHNMVGWRLLGKTWPHPFFDRIARAPTHAVTVLSRAERDGLRLLCGPHPGSAPRV